MLINLLRSALEAKTVWRFDYDGMVRVVEPHALGTNKKGELILRAFQVDGDSASNGQGWKLFVLERATQIEVLENGDSQAPRPGYKPGDRAMVEILSELPIKDDIVAEAA